MNQTQENILNSEVEIKGSIKFTNALRLEGKVEGQIISEGLLTLGSTGEVKGDVQVNHSVIEGKVQGNIIAKDKVELKGSAQLIGDIKTARLVIEDGVVFTGKCEVNPDGRKIADTLSRFEKGSHISEIIEKR